MLMVHWSIALQCAGDQHVEETVQRGSLCKFLFTTDCNSMPALHVRDSKPAAADGGGPV